MTVAGVVAAARGLEVRAERLGLEVGPVVRGEGQRELLVLKEAVDRRVDGPEARLDRARRLELVARPEGRVAVEHVHDVRELVRRVAVELDHVAAEKRHDLLVELGVRAPGALALELATRSARPTSSTWAFRAARRARGS